MVINGPQLLVAAPIKDMAPMKLSHEGTSFGLAEVGYDIRLKQDVLFTRRRISTQNGVKFGVCVQVDKELHPGRFAIASAMEEFDMPNDLMGIVHDKSTWARKGLSVFNTVIEPGWRGFLTLELVFHGRDELHIPAGSGIAQVIFHQLSYSTQYQGKYQDQADKPVEAVFA